jgi:hypothetical protein
LFCPARGFLKIGQNICFSKLNLIKKKSLHTPGIADLKPVFKKMKLIITKAVITTSTVIITIVFTYREES